MPTDVQNIELKCYLEGIPVKISNVNITEKAGQPPVAMISLPTDESVLELEPRTTVHVFYKDNTTKNWVLIFEGEIAAHGFTKSFENREVILRCVHISDHWNYVQKDLNFFLNFKAQKISKVFATTSSYHQKQLEKPIKEEQKALKEVLEKVTVTTDDQKDMKKEFKKAMDSPSDYMLTLKSAFGAISLESPIHQLISENEDAFANFFKALFDGFAKTNWGYTTFHIVYQMFRRFYTATNQPTKDIVLLKGVQKMILGKIKNLQGTSSAFQILNEVLSVLEYIFLIPSAPTWNPNKKVPESFLSFPRPMSFGPIACNTIFPDQVITAEYQRNMLQEPTRLADNFYPMIFDESATTQVLNKLIMAPTAALGIDDSSGEFYFLLTQEERMRGVNAFMQETNFESWVIQTDAYKKAQKEGGAKEKKIRDELITKLRKRSVDLHFEQQRLQKRSFSIDTTFSPHRVAGLPGFFLDEKLPTMIATISEIVHSIDARGQAMTQLSLFAPKPIKAYNWTSLPTNIDQVLHDFGYEIFSEEWKAEIYPFDENYTGAAQQDEKWIDHLYQKHVAPDTFPFFESWYEDAYIANNLQKNLYRHLMYGIDKDEDALEDFPYSNKNGGLLSFFNPDEMPFQNETDKTTKNTKWISQMLYALQNVYNARGPSFAKKFVQRRLITEEEFWEFYIGERNAVLLPKEKIQADDILPKGIRSVSQTQTEELQRLYEHLEKSGGTWSAPFVAERRAKVRKLNQGL